MIDGSSKIVITGAAQGIGRALARHFAKKGHRLFLFDIDEKKLKHTVTVHLKDYSENVAYTACDLTDTDAIRSAITKAVEHLGGRIDFLINNAGISTPYWPDGKTMEDPDTLDIFRKYCDVNLIGNFATSQACLPYMKVEAEEDKEKLPGSKVGTAGPCIVMIGSFRGGVSDMDQEGYAATKDYIHSLKSHLDDTGKNVMLIREAGLIGLVISMAVSLQRLGIRVNAVSPGRIRATHENQDGDDDDEGWNNKDDDVETHLTNRAGMPEDITEAVEYFLGAGFVTGQNLVVDGGITIKKAS